MKRGRDGALVSGVVGAYVSSQIRIGGWVGDFPAESPGGAWEFTLQSRAIEKATCSSCGASGKSYVQRVRMAKVGVSL